jgi:hypothetical protein
VAVNEEIAPCQLVMVIVARLQYITIILLHQGIVTIVNLKELSAKKVKKHITEDIVLK